MSDEESPKPKKRKKASKKKVDTKEKKKKRKVVDSSDEAITDESAESDPQTIRGSSETSSYDEDFNGEQSDDGYE